MCVLLMSYNQRNYLIANSKYFYEANILKWKYLFWDRKTVQQSIQSKMFDLSVFGKIAFISHFLQTSEAGLMMLDELRLSEKLS